MNHSPNFSSPKAPRPTGVPQRTGVSQHAAPSRWTGPLLTTPFAAAALTMVLVSFVSGCSEDATSDEGLVTGPTMLPGENCRRCHGGPSADEYPNAPNWTVAGTVFEGPESNVGAAGVTVEITDASGVSQELTTNSVGNFYTPTTFESPYTVTLKKGNVSVTMPVPPPSGGCNSCHNDPPIGNAPGKLYLPEDGDFEPQGVCDGDHEVTVGTTRFDCAPYVCAEDPGRCLNTCDSDDDCVEAKCSEEGLCVTP